MIQSAARPVDQVADEGFNAVHPESIIAENMPEVKLLGKVPDNEAKVIKPHTLPVDDLETEGQ